MSTLPYWSAKEKEGYIGATTRWVDVEEGTRAFLGIPERGEPPYPAMILGHERYGLVLDTLDQVAKFAAYGYVCIAPDMASQFEGDKEALNKGEIGGGWTPDTVKLYMAQSYDYLTTLPEVDPKRIAAIGLCASGGWPWILNSVRPDLAACICYYGGGRYNEELMANVTAPTLYVYGEKDHGTPIERVFEFRDEMERHGKNCEVRLEADMPHGWLNDTMPGRYRQREAQEAWDRIVEFTQRVYAGYYTSDKVRTEFAADFAVDYDFNKSVRYGADGHPEPSPQRFSALKQAVAEGRTPQTELDAFFELYPQYFAEHPELKS
ncbi:MAG: carboxymethylenebutenolidase [Chloroflexota bacterium]|jgi:carboxymethylenebutenolidase|nr:carboxymethylenebutenolidase [Chloroflexota bacterium]